MPDSFMGITVPDGDPGALESAASRFSGVSGALSDAAAQLQGMPGIASSWQGPASVAYGSVCLSQSGAARVASDTLASAAAATKLYAHELHGLQHIVRAAINDARDAKKRMDHAHDMLVAARARHDAAVIEADVAQGEIIAQSALGVPAVDASERKSQADTAAATAAADATHWQTIYDEAKGDLERAQRRGHHAMDEARDLGDSVAGVFENAAGLMPTLPPPPAPPKPKHEDQPWYKDVGHALSDAASWSGHQVVGLGKGAWEGVQGIGSAGAMLYRSSSINQLIDPASYERQQEQNREMLSNIWHHPGDFGKALVNWDDLSHGRVGEWLGNLAPDAAIALATGGAGAAIERGTAGGLRGAERLTEAGQAFNRADKAHDLLPPRMLKKTTGADGDLSLSGWSQPRPEGFGGATPDEVRGLSQQVGHPLEPHPWDRDFPGQYHASHAEKQLAVSSPNHPIGVSRPMCGDCQGFFRKLAEHTGQPQVVTDPDTTRLFLPDGRVINQPVPGDFPPLKPLESFNTHAAAGAGAGSHVAGSTQRVP